MPSEVPRFSADISLLHFSPLPAFHVLAVNLELPSAAANQGESALDAL